VIEKRLFEKTDMQVSVIGGDADPNWTGHT
jgi:hypothetical protein